MREIKFRGKSLSGKVYKDGKRKFAPLSMLPTPQAGDVKGNLHTYPNRQKMLGQMIHETFLLTPGATDGLRVNFTMDSLKNHNKPKANLSEQIAHKVGGGTSRLNPRFVAEMMGFPSDWTESPFLSGASKA